MSEPIKYQIDIGINPENRTIVLVIPIDGFMMRTKKAWASLKDMIKKDVIESKHIDLVEKES